MYFTNNQRMHLLKVYYYPPQLLHVPTHAPHHQGADKGRTIVTMHKETLKQKIDNFLKENQILQLNKDPTDVFHK
jgi:hypothetical protein